MTGQVAFTFDDRQLQDWVRAVEAFSGDARPLLDKIGRLAKNNTSRRFGQKGPGWPPVMPYFAELKRRSGKGSSAPLKFTGQLARSIDYQVVDGRTLRVGSTDRRAATHQFGTKPGEPRVFNLWIVPDKVPGKRKEEIDARDEAGRLLGRLTLAPIGAQLPGQGMAKKQRMVLNITARPFLKAPDRIETAEITAIASRHLLSLRRPGGGR